MKFETKNIIATTAIVIIAGIFFLNPHTNKTTTETWKKYSSQSIGVEFETPDYLQAFPAKEVVFSENESGPFFIDINTEFVGTKTVTEAMNGLPIEQKNHQKIIGERIVDGTEAIITISSDLESDPDQKTLYLVRGNLLYTISSRWIDEEKFWNSIKFLN